ncbi:MAG: hypothetical protein IPN14_09340 [Bacteroidetes bacterium]|jgi:hypothetical protein|nr:hypothetical protein [Bacteroidota bacterium]
MKHNKNILIPIDFTIESLNTLKFALEENKNEQLTVVLMYATHLSDSITELLFYSQYKIIQKLINQPFKDAINIINNTYESTLQILKIETFHGFHINALKHFLDAHHIEMIYIPLNYRLRTNKNSFDPIPMLKKSTFKYKEVSWHTNNTTSHEDELIQLFK